MQLTGFEAMHDLKGAFARARPSRGRVSLYWNRLVGAVRKYPRLAAGICGAVGVWTALVSSFCEMIDPYLSQYFPDMRLVAFATPTGELELHKVVKGVATSLGPLTSIDLAHKARIAQAKWTAVELRLSHNQLLQRTLALPAASRDFLGPIIEHRLERLTPWRPERVLYGFRTLDEEVPGGGVNVELIATSKDFVAVPLQSLGDAGFVPTAIGAYEDSILKPLHVNLFRHTAGTKLPKSRRLFSRIALTSLFFLAVICAASVLWAASSAERQDEAAVRLVKAKRLLRAGAMGALGDRERALLEAKRPELAMVVLIDKLATAIPQDTYLKELDVAPDKVRLVGISTNAAALIGELDATGLANVRFTSAVTREESGKDSFEITADRTMSTPAYTP